MIKLAATINYLLSNTPVEIVERAKDYIAKLIRRSKNRYVYRVGDKVVRIKIPVKLTKVTTKSIASKNILVSCNCKFWKFNGPDYNAFNQDYSEQVFSDLSEPIHKDPTKQFLICKHVFSALKQFKKDLQTK